MWIVVRATILSFLTLAWHIKCSPYPAGPIGSGAAGDTQRTIEKLDAVQVNAEVAQAASLSNITCPAVRSITQDSTLPDETTRISKARLLKRTSSKTSFGTSIDTILLNAAASPGKAINLRLNRRSSISIKKDSVEISIVDANDKRQHIISDWLRLNGSSADLTIEESRSEFENLQDSELDDVREYILQRANNMWHATVSALSTQGVVSDDFHREFNDRHVAYGEWKIKVSAFDIIPSYSYTMSRRRNQPQEYVDPSALISEMAIGVAICKLVSHLALTIRWQLSPKNYPAANRISTTDAMYLQIALHVLDDLLEKAVELINAHRELPKIDVNKAKDAMIWLGSSTAAVGHGQNPSTFLSFTKFAVELQKTSVCGWSGLTDEPL